MADSDHGTPTGVSTPIMPTGFGVADLEVAREHDALAAEAASAEQTIPPEQVPMDDSVAGPQASVQNGLAD